MMGCFSFVSLPRQTIMKDGTLRITNISKSDEGRYTCVARNHFGTSSSTGTLMVKGIYFFSTGFHYCTFKPRLQTFVKGKKNTSSSMKLIMKYIAVLCSRRFDRRISHPWFCQLWVIVHVAEWGIPPPSKAVSEKYFVTSIQFKKSCCSVFRLGFLNNDDCRERESSFFLIVDIVIAAC